MQKAETAREAFLRGVQEERHRIARDLHDHLGAQLLTGLYAESADQAREGIRHALSDMRSVVHELTRDEQLELDAVLADLRHETLERLAAAGLTLEWPVAGEPVDRRVSPRMSRHLTGAVRELVSNVIRHARAEALLIATRVRGNVFEFVVLDDGLGFAGSRELRAEQGTDGEAAPESRIVPAGGRGLGNVAGRAQELGGELRLFDLRNAHPEGVNDLPEQVLSWMARSPRGAGALVVLTLPLEAGAAEERAS
jgi:signal transduction histidine kinase